ncbi:hypothetical protein U9M48_002321 [Paspalum notatum var. saurae]|uniref:Uncharacterized protein n=1 Tax=Paspalum notatum var. saurae TaxID=547442 RepID=A0AAQ3SJP8_PASNO
MHACTPRPARRMPAGEVGHGAPACARAHRDAGRLRTYPLPLISWRRNLARPPPHCFPASPPLPRGPLPLSRVGTGASCPAKMLGFSTGQLLVILGSCSIMMKPSDMVKIARTTGRMTRRAVGRLIVARRQLDEILRHNPRSPREDIG